MPPRKSFLRENRAMLGVFAFLIAAYFCVEYAKDEYQRRQEYSGTVVRKYSALEYTGSHTYRLYWDIREPNGEMHSPRIRPKDFWRTANPGDHVVKRAGKLFPEIVRR